MLHLGMAIDKAAQPHDAGGCSTKETPNDQVGNLAETGCRGVMRTNHSLKGSVSACLHAGPHAYAKALSPALSLSNGLQLTSTELTILVCCRA